MRRIISLWLPIAFALTVVGVQTVKAQTPIDSNSVNVSYSAPNVVWFTYPTEPGSNVVMIKFGCNNSPFRETFIYEEDSLGHITPYYFPGGLACVPNSDGTSYTLAVDVTLTTSDHTVTIKQSTNWTAALEFCGRGRCWKATGGSSQIVVQ